MSKIEITGTLLDVRWPPNCENFFVGTIQIIKDGQPAERVKICGTAEPDELKQYLTYRWYGHYPPADPRWGLQFKAETFTPAKPHGRTGVVKYLQQCDGIGEQTAIAIWNNFASDSVKIAREHPEIIASKISRLKLETCQAMSKVLKDLSALEDVGIEMIDILNGRGFPKATARAAIKKWGNKALWVLQHDPFKLMSFRGCGYLRCDSMYLDLGLPPAKMKRQCYSIWYSLASDSNGHTWLPETTARQFLSAKISGAEVDYDKALGLAKRAGMLRERLWCQTCEGTGRTLVPDFFGDGTMIDVYCKSCDGGQRATRWLAEAKKADAEDFIAEHIAKAGLEKPNWPVVPAAEPDMPGPSVHQAGEIATATMGVICALLGSPGTGKTYVAAAIVQAILRKFSKFDVAVCAPTGKAAVRCTQSMNSYGISNRASTIHGLLGVASGGEDGGWSFEHDEHNPLPFKFIIVDEASMLSVPLMRALLAARAKGTHILFVGDPNQLPPIEHGAPLRDFIAAGLPHGKLVEIRRNAGTIVRACAAIRDNRPAIEMDPEIVLEKPCPACGGTCKGELRGDEGDSYRMACPTCKGTGKDPDFAPQNLKLVTASKALAPAEIEKVILELKEKGIDPIWACQVIVAVNKRSPLARTTLNARLQTLLNPAGVGVIGSPFKTGDKVICLKNSFFKPDDPYAPEESKTAVANGEFGRVYKVEPTKTCVEFFNPPRKVIVGRFKTNPKAKENADDEKAEEAGTGCDLDLGYACTCHKMQGSDADYVIVGLDEYPGATGPHGICSREWTFTAISRARIACYLVGLRGTLRTQCSETKLDKRKTFLAELIRNYRSSYSASAKPMPAIQAPISTDNNWQTASPVAVE